MIKKLKKQFVLINMLLLTFVLLIIFASVFFLMYNSELKQSERMMQNVIDFDSFRFGNPPNSKNDAPFEFKNTKPEQEKLPNNMLRNSFLVQLDEAYNVINIQYQIGDTVDNATIEETAKQVIKNESKTKIVEINDTEYRYLIKKKPYGTAIVFLDRSIEITTLNRLAVISLIIGSVSMILLFFISLFLSNRVVNPIAEAWDKQKQFVADASHELKTPLTVINANTDVILSNPKDTIENQSKWLEYIKAEISRMSKLVNNLLYIAKTDSDKEKFEFSSFNLSEAVTGVCLVFEPLIFERGKSLDCFIDSDITYTGDEEGIKQLITILLDNALSHSNDNGHIEIYLNTDKQKNKIRLTVSNTGEGIPDEHFDKIFERFYRVDKSRSRDTGGCGLGLSIAKTIVERHKGSISVQSKNGGMTSFIVIL